MSRNTKTHHLELARKIIDTALDLNIHVGAQLVEKNLATACDVSRTPIRAALKILEQQGLVQKSPRGGYILVCDPAQGTELALVRFANAEHDLAHEILRDRAGRRLAEKVTVSDLIRRYKASRGVVQKTLDTLQDQGLVARAAGQSWIFSRMLEDASVRQQSYEFRLLLEPQAILSEGFLLDANRSALVRRQTEALQSKAENSISASSFRKADIAFHELIAKSSGNKFIQESLLAHHRLRQLPGAISRMSDFRLRQALEEHLKILDYLTKNQNEIAADLMRLHLRVSQNRRPGVANRGLPALVGPYDMNFKAARTG